MSGLIVFKNGRVIDPKEQRDAVGDLWIKDGEIIGPADDVQDAETFDLAGLWVVPGLIDMHVHLREPGEEYKETIETGARAGAAGGFTGLVPVCQIRNRSMTMDL